MSNPSAVEELFSSVFEEAQQLNKVAQINQVDVILEKYDAVMNEYWAIVKNNGMHPQLLEIVDKILEFITVANSTLHTDTKILNIIWVGLKSSNSELVGHRTCKKTTRPLL